jgi:ABC-type transport system substrate-binding protein
MNCYLKHLLLAILGSFFLSWAWAQPQVLRPAPSLFPAAPPVNQPELSEDLIEEPPDYSRYGGTLTVATGPVTTLDSQLATDINSRLIIANIQEGLYGYDEQNQLVPVLADCMPEMQDEVTYLIYLKEDIKFHDGTSLTAQDVVYTVERLLNPNTAVPTRMLFTNIKSAQALDENVVEIKLNQPDNTLAYLFARQELYPLSDETVERYGPSYGKVMAVGTGPFRLVEWQRGEMITLKRSDIYYDTKLPYLNLLVFKPQADKKQRIEHLSQRRLSVAVDLTPQVIHELENRYVKVVSTPGTLLEQIYLNTSRPPFDNKVVRQALAYGIDRRALVDQVFLGHATVAQGIFPPWHWAHDPEWRPFEYDPQKAAQLLRNSDYWGGIPLEFKLMYTQQPKFEQQASLIKEQLDRLGFRVILQSLPKPELLDYVYGRQGKDRAAFAAALEDWQGGMHPDLYSSLLYSAKSFYNKTLYNDPLVERLLQDASESVREDEKGMFYRQVERLVTQDANTIYLCFPHQIYAYRTYVRGLRPTPLGVIDFAGVWIRR